MAAMVQSRRLPADEAAAPMSIVGTPNISKSKAATQQMIWAEAVEVLDSVL